MADKVKVRLLRPLNGEEIGTEKEYSKADAERLAGFGSVEIFGKVAPAPQNKMVPASESKADLPALSGMTKDELIAQAAVEGVDLSGASNNDERREAIEKARK